MTTILNGLDEIPELFAGIQEDFERINFTEYMLAELDLLSEWNSALFQNQMAPDGSPWKENAPSTIRRKGHSRILRGHPRNGHRLQRSLVTNSHSSSGDMVREAVQTDTGGYMAHGTAVEYSAYNQNRPHVGINENYLDMMTERAADYTLAKLAE